MKYLSLFYLLFLSQTWVQARDLCALKIDSILVLVDKCWGDTCIPRDPLVTCLTFGTNIQPNRYMLRSSDSGKTFRHVCDEIKTLQKYAQGKSPVMDVRSKMYFFSSDSIIFTACIDRRITLIDGEYYTTTEHLCDIVNKILGRNKIYIAKDIKIHNKDNFVASSTDSLICFLQKHLSLVFECSEHTEFVDVRLACRVNNKGENIKAYVFQFYVDGVKMRVPKWFSKELEEFVKKNVKWNENPERTVHDIMTMRISFPPN